MTNFKAGLTALSGAALLGGCATQPRPTAERVRGTLKQVTTAELEQVPDGSRAHRFRQQARQSYQEAAQAMAAGRNRTAALWLERAEADAALALALAREDALSAEADEIERGLADAVRGEQR